ncbi:MAG: RidA family protein [Hyphomicrobiales bacterium]|nr:RidA family protein [Hyphomicrobiales bacterium]
MGRPLRRDRRLCAGQARRSLCLRGGNKAIESNGRLHAPGDTYAQAMFIFRRIEEALAEVGAKMHHIVGTRAFLTDMAAGGGAFVRAHGEVFAGIDPVTSGVEARLTIEGMMIEIEADALIADEAAGFIGG